MGDRFAGVSKQPNGKWMSCFFHGEDIKVIASENEDLEELAAFEIMEAVKEFDIENPTIRTYFVSKALRRATAKAKRERDHKEARSRMLSRQKFFSDTRKALKAPNHMHNMKEIEQQFNRKK